MICSLEQNASCDQSNNKTSHGPVALITTGGVVALCGSGRITDEGRATRGSGCALVERAVVGAVLLEDTGEAVRGYT